jgi:hypothetical protein
VSPSFEPDPDAPLLPSGERRGEHERRAGERRHLDLVPSVELRARRTRRRTPNRRTGSEFPGTETVEEHIRNALQLLTTIAETETLGDDQQRNLDAAIFRLHFAIERLQQSGH